MNRALEDRKRRRLRARDAMDRTCAEPLDVSRPPVMDEKAAAQVRDLLAMGATGVVLVPRTDDCFGTYERLRAEGVELTQEATDHGYGIDCGLRDPFANQIRTLQPKAWQGKRG